MFQTLKPRRGNLGDTEYITQFADIPFQKNPKKRPAYTYCKPKKLRRGFGASNNCSGCERQGVECSHGEKNTTSQDPQSLVFSTSQPLHTQSSNQSQEKKQQQQQQEQHHQQLQQKQQPEEDLTLVHDSDSSCYIGNSIENDPVSKTNDDLAIDLGSSSGPYSGDYILPDLDVSNDYLDFLNLSNNDQSVLSDQQPNNGNLTEKSILSATISADTDNHNHHPMTGLTVGPLELQDWLPVLHSPMDFVNLSTTIEIHQSRDTKETSQPQQHLQQQSSTECCCIDDILAANEKIQLQLVSEGHYSTTNIDNTLQCQKNVLTCIEGLLECVQCTSRSDYIIFTISVCRAVMTSVINVIDTTINPVLTDADPTSLFAGVKHSRNRRDIHMTDPSIGNDSFKMTTTTAGRWRLDDYEEMQIAWNLMNLRVLKLQRLIQQLEQVAIANQLGCIRVVQAMRCSFESRIAAMKPARSRWSWEAAIENIENR